VTPDRSPAGSGQRSGRGRFDRDGLDGARSPRSGGGPGQREAEGSDESVGLPSISTQNFVQMVALTVVLVVGIYFLLPKLAGFGDAITTVGKADLSWVIVAFGFGVLSFIFYIALFRGVVGGETFPITLGEAYQINMAGFAAKLLFSAAGAGGVVLTYWALRQGGMDRRETATRMVTFLSLSYIFYPLALIVFGVLLRTGVLNGSTAVTLTVIPAAIAGLVLILGILVAILPRDEQGRVTVPGARRGLSRLVALLGSVQATVSEGVRAAFRLIVHPVEAAPALIGAVGYWAANIGILWASFKALGVAVPFGVVVMGFFIGMAANLVPFVPAGVGAVDAGLIGAFVLFGQPQAEVFAAVLIFRLMAFWLPIPPGVVAFFQLRRTVKRWRHDGLPVDRPPRKSLISVPFSF